MLLGEASTPLCEASISDAPGIRRTAMRLMSLVEIPGTPRFGTRRSHWAEPKARAFECGGYPSQSPDSYQLQHYRELRPLNSYS